MEAGTKPWTTFLATVTSPPSLPTAKSVWTVDFVPEQRTCLLLGGRLWFVKESSVKCAGVPLSGS